MNSNIGIEKPSSFKDRMAIGIVWLERFTARVDAGMIVISNSIKTDTCKRFEISEDRLSVIYCGINTNIFKPSLPDVNLEKEFNIPADAKVVSIIARLAAVKNHKMFLRVARQICQNRKDIYFIIVGPSGTRDYISSNN